MFVRDKSGKSNVVGRIFVAVVIAAFGSLASSVHLYHGLTEEGVHTVTLGVLFPLSLSLIVVVAGVWLYYSPLDDEYIISVAGWTGLGVVGGVLFGYPVVPYQSAHGVPLVDIQFLVVNWATGGAISGFLIGLYDAHKRQYRTTLETKQAELAAREDELERENTRLHTFATLLSHDLRNPLNVAIGRLEIAEETGDRRHFATIQDALDRMETIIDEMLTIAREGNTLDEGDLSSISVAPLAESCWDMVDTFDATLEVEDDVTVSGNTGRLRHVFENLFRNAIEHSDGPVTVRVGTLSTAEGFYVEDDGPGIPADDRDTVFEPRYTTSSDGTGYGLYLVKLIIEAHGWDVTLTAGTDGGARFEITTV